MLIILYIAGQGNGRKTQNASTAEDAESAESLT